MSRFWLLIKGWVVAGATATVCNFLATVVTASKRVGFLPETGWGQIIKETFNAAVSNDTTALKALFKVPEKVTMLVTPAEAVPGILCFLGMIIAGQLVYVVMKKIAPKLQFPTVLYITFIGIIVTCPNFLPFAPFVSKSVGKIGLLPLCTPILAYSGIAAGKDLDSFKKQGLAIVCVTLIALIGTFVGSAIIAHIVMKYTGVF